MTEEDQKYEEVANAIISYLDFIKEFKTKKEDYVITNEQNNTKLKYVFRNYNLDCFIIDKKYLDEFRKATNFDKLTQILKDNTEENKNKFKEELTKYLNENPYRFDEEEIKLYSKEDELKGIVNNFNSYSFVNKEICEIMGVSEDLLNSNVVKISKNSVNTALLFSKNNFIISINMDKNKKENITNENDEKNKTKAIEAKDGNNEKYKNLYYVEEITKKVFALLYFNEQNIKNKLEKKIKDIYNFKKYYLINSKWLKEYKEKIKYFLNDIIKSKIGQISLNQDTKISKYIRNAQNLICKIIDNNIKIKTDRNNEQETLEPEENEKFSFPNNFNLIDEDIFNLLMKEEFFINVDDNLKEILCYNVLIGNNQIIINNKTTEKKEEKFKYSHEYLFYSKKEEDNENQYDLKYILNFNKNEDFFFSLEKIIKEGVGKYASNLEVDLEQKEYEVLISDDKKNIIGKFVNIGLSEKNIKNCIDKNLFGNKEEKSKIIIENKIHDLNDKKIKNKNKVNFIIIRNKGFEIKNQRKNLKNIFKIINNDSIQIEGIIKNKGIENGNKQMGQIENNDFGINNDIINDVDEKNLYNENINFQNNNDNLKYEEYNEDKDKINLSNNKENNSIAINQLKAKLDDIEKLYKNLFNVILNSEKKNLEIQSLIPNEIIKKKNETNMSEIILIESKSSEEFKSLINYDLMTEYINSGEEKKNELLNEYKEKFIDINKIFQGKISKKFSLIENCKNLNIENGESFLILNKKIFQDIYEEAKNIHIYFFLYQDSSYIYFEEEKKIMTVEWSENDLCFIYDIDENSNENENENINKNENKNKKKNENKNKNRSENENKNINKNENENEILEGLKKINNKIAENRQKLIDLSFDEDMNKKYFQEYYLINRNWIIQEINKFKNKGRKSNTKNKLFNKKNFKVKVEQINSFKYSTEFEFIDKDSFEPIIKELAKKEEINIEDFPLVKIFFVNWQNNILNENVNNYQARKYICIIGENNIVFYRFSKYYCDFEYYINFNDEKIMKEEIQKYIIKKGIGSYFNDICLDPSNETFNLINYNLKLFGSCINFKNYNNKIDTKFKLKALKIDKNQNFFNDVLLCLVNIEQLKNFFCDREKLINLIEEDSVFSKYFYKIVQDMRLDINEEKNKDDIYINLKNEIIKKSESNDILNNIKLLIEFILLRIHNELRTDKNDKKIKTKFSLLDKIYQDYNEINKTFYPINKSIIKDLFFIEIEMNYECKNCNHYEEVYFLKSSIDFDITQKSNILKAKKIISIYDLFGLEENKKCIICNNDCLLRRIINTCPKILILVIKLDKYSIKFNAQTEINIMEYSSKKNYQTRYELISFIQNHSITFCKSEQNIWYKYEGANVKQIKDFNNIQNKVPYLLIYKQKFSYKTKYLNRKNNYK